LIDAGVCGSTWTTATAALDTSSGSIQSVTGIRLRWIGKPATRAPISAAASPSAPVS
jgi:hypothetical protein